MNDRVKATLNGLIQANTDCSHGLETASNNVTDTDCLMLLRQLAEERSAQAIQLQEVLAMEGDFPRPTGTLPGDARQMWIAVRGTISGQDELSVLPEVAKVEERLRQEYEAALAELQETPVGELIAAHCDNVTAACQSIVEMCELMERRAESSI